VQRNAAYLWPFAEHQKVIDTYKLKGLRQRLVTILRDKGIQDDLVLDAIGKVPRHAFVESAFAEASYEDRALPIAEGQTISQPYTVAYQTQILQVKPGMKVLEIGTGSGYQAAILCELGAKLYSIERHRPLHQRAQELLTELGYKPRLKWGDGTAGWTAYAPFDRILVTAASPGIPDTFKEQLAIGGRLVIPVGDRDSQTMVVVVRKDTKEFLVEEKDKFRFVPMIGKHGWDT
jgi:protein-L-isoaspartate(D-aspartate) O-methyltransferase